MFALNAFHLRLLASVLSVRICAKKPTTKGKFSTRRGRINNEVIHRRAGVKTDGMPSWYQCFEVAWSYEEKWMQII